MKHIIRVIALIIFFVSLVNLSLIYAQQETNLPSIFLKPGMTYYPIERLYEKLLENLQFTNETKEKYYENLLQKRIAELKYVVDKDYLDQVEKSTQRVSYQVGVLTDYIVRKKLINKKQGISDLYRGDETILGKLRDKYPANSAYWMLIQHSINSIDLNSQKL